MSDEAPELRPVRTSKYITKFELARLIGLRMLQLHEKNEVADGETAEQMAIREIRTGSNPSVIRRRLPDGCFEDVRVSSLLVDDDLARFHLNPSRFQSTDRF